MKIRPAVAEAFKGLSPSDIKRVAVFLVDLSQRFNQVRCIALVAAESSPNRVGVNCYSQSAVDSWFLSWERRHPACCERRKTRSVLCMMAGKMPGSQLKNQESTALCE